MTTGRLLVAGLAVVWTLMAADASAQDCPEWFKWLCPDSASSNPATKEAAQPHRGTGCDAERKRRARCLVQLTSLVASYGMSAADYSGLMFASRITLP